MAGRIGIPRRLYTEEDEKVIFEEVQNNQHNIKKGLTIAAERLGRSYGSVNQHWYMIQSKKETAFCLFNSSGVTKNRKCSNAEAFQYTPKRPILLRILNLLHIPYKK